MGPSELMESILEHSINHTSVAVQALDCIWGPVQTMAQHKYVPAEIARAYCEAFLNRDYPFTSDLVAKISTEDAVQSYGVPLDEVAFLLFLRKSRLPHNPLVVYLDPRTTRDMREKHHYDAGVTVDKNVNSWFDDTRGCYNLQASEVLLRVAAMAVFVFRHVTPRLATALNLPIASKQEARRLLA